MITTLIYAEEPLLTGSFASAPHNIYSWLQITTYLEPIRGSPHDSSVRGCLRKRVSMSELSRYLKVHGIPTQRVSKSCLT